MKKLIILFFCFFFLGCASKSTLIFNPKYIEVTERLLYTWMPKDLVEVGKVHSDDGWYKVPLDPKYIMKMVPTGRKPYIPHENDCDDGVRAFRGWLSMNGWGNMLCMDVVLYIKNWGRHNVIGFVDPKDRTKILFGDTFMRKIVKYKNAEITDITF